MYPQGELIHLARHKRALRRRLARQRTECAEAAGWLLRPVAWVDRALTHCRRVFPLFNLGARLLGLLATRAQPARFRVLTALFRWGGLLLGTWRIFGAAR